MLFKLGIQPYWEHPECQGGGKWTVMSPSSDSGKLAADKFWHTV